jgi:Mn2+/Fe2+ NRAMP family transporter
MIAIQMVSARIGAVTGQGLAANLAKAMPRSALHFFVGLLLIANTLNIAADIAAMGDALRLVIGGPMLVYIALFGISCLAAEILIPYHNYSRYLKTLTLVLFAYVATAFTIRIPWGQVLFATFVPHLSWNRDYTLMLVAIFGTTISPYMFFWQASLEAEGRKLRGKAQTAATAAALPNRLAPKDSLRIGLDTTAGMVLSNVIGFFIIITTGATLHAHGMTHIDTASQAAEALRPLAGPLAFFLFALGIIGTGLLAVPVLAGSAGYAVAESFGWEGSLELPARGAPGFYLVVGASTLAGLGAALTPLDPIRMLFWSAVVNGVVAVPLMVAMMIVVANRTIMGKYAASRALKIGGWAATALMAVVVAAMLVTSLGG